MGPDPLAELALHCLQTEYTQGLSEAKCILYGFIGIKGTFICL